MNTPEQTELFNLLNGSTYPFLIDEFLRESGQGWMSYNVLENLDRLAQTEVQPLINLSATVRRQILYTVDVTSSPDKAAERKTSYNALNRDLRQYIDQAHKLSDWFTPMKRLKPTDFVALDSADEQNVLVSIDPDVEATVIHLDKYQQSDNGERPTDRYARWLGIEPEYITIENNELAFQHKTVFVNAETGLRGWYKALASLSDAINLLTPIQLTQVSAGLTAREKMLIICYEAVLVINKGEPNYGDYITFANPKKRIAYANKSNAQAKSLIRSIQKILPYLSERARQQADREIITMEANIV